MAFHGEAIMPARLIHGIAVVLVLLQMVATGWADEEMPEFSFRYGEVGKGQQTTPDAKLGLREREYTSEKSGLRDVRLELADSRTIRILADQPYDQTGR
jgi:hypothetical protein